MSEKKIITASGKHELEDELQKLNMEIIPDIARRLKEARAQGDLSENAEYHAAKEEQEKANKRKTEIEDILKNSEVANEVQNLDVVSIGTKVKILDLEFNEEQEYLITGAVEANAIKGKISNESPVGKALIGARVGDEVEVTVPIGTVKYRVLAIGRD